VNNEVIANLLVEFCCKIWCSWKFALFIGSNDHKRASWQNGRSRRTFTRRVL